MFNIVRQQDSHAFEVRLESPEESLHHAPSCENTVHEVASGKTRVVILKPARTKRDKALHLKDWRQYKKHQTPFVNLGGDQSRHAHSLAQTETPPRKAYLKHPLSVRILESRTLMSMEKPPKLSNYGRKRVQTSICSLWMTDWVTSMLTTCLSAICLR